MKAGTLIIGALGITALAMAISHIMKSGKTSKLASSTKDPNATDPLQPRPNRTYTGANGVSDSEQEIYSEFLGIRPKTAFTPIPSNQVVCKEGCTKIWIADSKTPANSRWGCDCKSAGIKKPTFSNL